MVDLCTWLPAITMADHTAAMRSVHRRLRVSSHQQASSTGARKISPLGLKNTAKGKARASMIKLAGDAVLRCTHSHTSNSKAADATANKPSGYSVPMKYTMWGASAMASNPNISVLCSRCAQHQARIRANMAAHSINAVATGISTRPDPPYSNFTK